MSLRGQRFELDLDADDFTAKPLSSSTDEPAPVPSLVGDIKERSPAIPATAPKPRDSKTGFPAHRKRTNLSVFKRQSSIQGAKTNKSGIHHDKTFTNKEAQLQNLPSDRAIAHHINNKYGLGLDAKEKQEISQENRQRIAAMTAEDIDEARAELMSSLNPGLIERLLKRASIDENAHDNDVSNKADTETEPVQQLNETGTGPVQASDNSNTSKPQQQKQQQQQPSQSDQHLVPPIHFPQPPPVDPSTFVPLDPSSPSFVQDLKKQYFPSTPHEPSSMAWLTDPTEEEDRESPYNPAKDSYHISQLRFSFTGAMIPPSESLDISVDRGLHHHGLAPSSAGYTVPELAILSRSTMPSQRCIAYQILGRTIYRLGQGQFGVKADDLYEGLWELVERERVVEIMMAEANQTGGHVSAKAYAVDALWLWRRGCGGERGLAKERPKRAL